MNKLSITILSTIITLYGCLSKDISIDGHWHSVEEDLWARTLDIDDSITIIDKYEIDGSQLNTYLRKDPKTGKRQLPFQDYISVNTYSINNDTLTITNYGYSYKYIRSNIKQCELNDRYIDLAINISLSESSSTEAYDNLLYTVDLFIGTSIKPDYNTPKSSPDSVFIQADDVFINLNQITRYCKERGSAYLPNDQINLVLHVDNQVNEIFIRSLVKRIPSNFKVYTAVKREGQLCVAELNAG